MTEFVAFLCVMGGILCWVAITDIRRADIQRRAEEMTERLFPDAKPKRKKAEIDNLVRRRCV